MLRRSPLWSELGVPGSYVGGAMSICRYKSSTATPYRCKRLQTYTWLGLFSLSQRFPCPVAEMNRCVSKTDEGWHIWGLHWLFSRKWEKQAGPALCGGGCEAWSSLPQVPALPVGPGAPTQLCYLMPSSPKAVLSLSLSSHLPSLSRDPVPGFWTILFSYWPRKTFWGAFLFWSKLRRCHILSRYSTQQPVETRGNKKALKGASFMFCSYCIRNTGLLPEWWKRQQTVLQTPATLTLHKFRSCSGNWGLPDLLFFHHMREELTVRIA